MGLIIVVAAVVVFFAGFASYGGFKGFGLAGNDNVEGCAAAKANLVAKHSQTCSQRVAVASGSIPIIGPIIAAAAAIASSLAAAYSIFLLGRYTAACAEYATQSKGLAEAMRLEDAATGILSTSRWTGAAIISS